MATAEEEILEIVYDSFTDNIIAVAATTLIVYEHVLTIGEVVNTIYQRRALSSILIGLNQLFLLLFAVFNILAILPWTNAISCEATIIPWAILIAALVVISAVTTALRVYVISGADWRLAVPTLILGVASIFIYIGVTFHDASYLTTRYPTSPSFVTCWQSFNASYAGLYAAIVLPFMCTFTSDVIVILVTWIRMRAYSTSRRFFSQTSSVKPRLAELFFIDGTLYFFVISLLNVAELVCNCVFFATNFLMAITIPMSSILITRFLINVRESAYITTVDSSGTRDITRARENSELPTLIFGDPETSLQMDRSLSELDGRPGQTNEWDSIDEEDWEGAEADKEAVKLQVLGASSTVDDLDNRPGPSASQIACSADAL